MKLSLIAAIATFIVTAVLADRSVIVLLNNGEDSAYSCSTAELDQASAILYASSLNSTYGRRHLRTTMEDLDDMTDSILTDPQHRTLANGAKCKNLCAGVATGRCLAVDCKGYRRRSLIGEEQDDRNLLSGASFTCTQQVDYINAELNKLASGNQVSSSCKTFLSRPRSITCFDDVIYGVVENFRLWDTAASPQKIINDNFIGGDICSHQEVTIQAQTNECVDHVLNSLQGSNGYYAEKGEYKLPFSIFGDYFWDGNPSYAGRKLPVGQYELTSLPDGLQEKKKTLKFNVVAGSVIVIKLWDMAAKTIINSNFVSGGKVCNNKSINFEIVMSSCAWTSKTKTTSTNGFSFTNTESYVPFSALGDVNGILNGKKLANGAYTMTIYPNQIESDQVKTIKFNVVSC